MDEDKSPEERIDSLLENADSGNQGGSIFASLRPAPTPSRPAPTPPARPLAPLPTPSKPALQENDAVKMLKAKVEELEKRLRERESTAPPPHPGAAPPTPPGSRAPATPQEDRSLINFFKTRMEELEKRLYAVQEKALASTIELKSREDAQRGARKEMEDLLKAIREQQRSSELDRQSAKQLERSHARIEELEKKLLDFSNQALRQGQNNGTFQDESSAFRREVLQALDGLKEGWAQWQEKASASGRALRREMLEHLSGQEEKQAEWQKKNLAVQQEMMERFADTLDGLKEGWAQWQEKVSASGRALRREMLEHLSGQDEKLAKWQEMVEDINKCMSEVKGTVFAWMEAGGVSEVLEERLLRLEKAISEGDDMQPPLVSLPRQISALRVWISDIRKELKNRG